VLFICPHLFVFFVHRHKKVNVKKKEGNPNEEKKELCVENTSQNNGMAIGPIIFQN